MPFARIRELSHRLRVRLAVWYGGAFAVLIAAASLIGLRRPALRARRRNRLSPVGRREGNGAGRRAVLPERSDDQGDARPQGRQAHARTTVLAMARPRRHDALGRQRNAGRTCRSSRSASRACFRSARSACFASRSGRSTIRACRAYVVRVGASQEQINASRLGTNAVHDLDRHGDDGARRASVRIGWPAPPFVR